MRSRILLGVVLVSVFVGLLGGAAAAEIPDGAAYTTAADCYACHQGDGPAIGKVDFSASASVDYLKCRACHADPPSRGHYHFGYPTFSALPGVVACYDCHDDEVAFSFVLPAGATSVVGPRPLTPYGYFATSTSLLADAATLHRVHAQTGWVEATFGGACSRCHASAACSACHDDSVLHGDHAVTGYPAIDLKQATGVAVTYAPSTCVNEACHAIATAGTAAFTPACTACHPARSAIHGYESIGHVAADAAIEGVACSACHALDLATAHGDPGAGGASCATCHPTPRDSFAAWSQSCATGDCHTPASAAPMHAGADASHVLPETGALCVSCHEGADLGAVHAGATDADTGASSCLVCHTAAGAPVTNDCTVCHFTFEAHYPAQAHAAIPAASGCRNCHSMDLKTEHDKYAVTCLDCHNGYVDAFTAPWNKTCDACHTSRHSDRGRR
jgi:hypothetical protein